MSQHHFSRRNFIKTTSLALPLVAAGCAVSHRQAARAQDFVTVRQGRFERRGRPYFYLGANMWFGCYLGDRKLAGGRARLRRELDRLKLVGVTNVRLLGGSESSPLTRSIARGITRGPHDWDEELLVGLDFCLSEMARRDMTAVMFLSNFWQWSGGFAQYVSAATGKAIPDPDLPTTGAGDWPGFIKFSASLYRTPAANDLYLDFVARLLQRRNSINGRLYCDDPTIMTWELANEPRPGTDSEETMKDVPAFCGWVDATARFIRERAPRQLVCTGSEGVAGCLNKPEVFVAAHQTAAIDYVTVHIWLKNWGWLKDPCLSDDFERATARARDHLEMHNALATDQLHKPLVLEEFGMPRDHENYDPSSPTTARDEYYRRMFQLVVASGRAGRALQAANFWAWAGEGRAGEGRAAATTTLMGDPFFEPQGLNSVLDTDHTTLDVIRKFSRMLSSVPA